MRMPMTLRQAWRMRGMAALGAIIGVSGFLAAEAVLTNGARADGVIAEPKPMASEVRPTARAAHSPRRPFGNCTEARAAGAAPVYLGDPGYGEHLDGDLDGIGCEPHRGR